MGSSDDEQAIMQAHILLEWVKELPKTPGSYDYPTVSETDQALYIENLKKWVQKKPKFSNKRKDDR